MGYVIHCENPGDYGLLRQKADRTKGLEWQGQAHYDRIGDLVMRNIQERMVKEYGLKEVLIPEDKHLEEEYRHLPRNNIFMSPDFHSPPNDDQAQKDAMVLIQGTGAVRAGVWARSVCINESMEKGSMLPLLSAARQQNMSVIVFNPNLNRVKG
jgi:hypothetical protein